MSTLPETTSRSTAPAPITSVPPAAASPKAHKSTGQGLFTVWHGVQFGVLREMLRQKPKMEWAYWGRIASVGMVAPLNSFNAMLESAIFGRKVARTEITKPPIFILGHWRSGTTLLHNLMTLDKQFTYPNLYQVLFSGHFLLTEWYVPPLTGPFLPKKRPMDNMEAGWKLPQEDEVALMLQTLISPYVMTLYQNERKYYGDTFDIRDLPPEKQARWKQALIHFMKKLTVRENKSIVMKSPTHTYRVATLLEIFPDAKFVYIRRDPYAVYSSTVHLRRTMFSENGFRSVDETNIREEALKTYDHCISTYESTRHLIPVGNLHEMRFEDLERDVMGEMKKMYDGLSLPGWEEVRPALQKEADSMGEYKKNKFKMGRAEQEMVYNTLKPHFERYGYPDRFDETQPGT